MKACPKCKRFNPECGYSPAKRNSDGLASWCRGCTRVAANASREAQKKKPKVIPEEKPCGRCKEIKPKDAFCLNPAYPSGLDSVCKQCEYERRRASVEYKSEYDRVYREANRERLLGEQRQRYHTNREEINAKRREEYATDPEVRRKTREQNRRWQKANRQRVREYKKQWKKDNPDKHLANRRRDKAKRRTRETNQYVEDTDDWLMFVMYEYRCGLCGYHVHPEEIHVDHRKPVSKGGLHEQLNVQPSHPHCNLVKNNKSFAGVLYPWWVYEKHA